MIGNVFDGIERPLSKLQEYSGDFLKKGCNIDAIDLEKKWHFIPSVNLGEKISRNTIVGTVKESEFFDHKIMNPNHIEAEVIYIAPEGEYTAKDTIAKIRDNEKEYNITMVQKWPVRIQRPYKERLTVRTESYRYHVSNRKRWYSNDSWRIWNRKNNVTASNGKMVRCGYYSLYWLWGKRK